jgi:ferredoxin-NADP reductase
MRRYRRLGISHRLATYPFLPCGQGRLEEERAVMRLDSVHSDSETWAPAREGVLEMVVCERTVVADGVVHLILREVSGGTLPVWEPGAHVDLLLEPDLVRQYSLCGDPADRSRFEVAVLREPDGRGGSAYVHDKLDRGASVRVRGPRNHFRLVASERYLFIAGGIGITPILPMIDAVARSGAQWRLVYGGRSRASMAFGAELAARYEGCVSICPQDEAGLLDLGAMLSTSVAGTAVYCCGPEGLLAAVEGQCASWPADALHVERFSAKPFESTGPDRAFAVELAQSGRTVSVPAGANLLDVLEADGVEVIMSCREGTCGTCETRVLSGVVDHRDSVLTAQERAANEVMLPCVSRCLSDILVLDL